MKRFIVLPLLLVGLAVAASNTPLGTSALAQLRSLAEPLFDRGPTTQPRFDDFYAEMVEDLPPQARAERALELAINRYQGAPGYVMEQAQLWRGQFGTTDRLTALVTTAINSPRMEVRMAAFEVHLAQFDLDKSPAQVDHLVERMLADPEGAGPWALWSMAAIGARGVDRERIYDELIVATDHPSARVRRWAVDSLARLGGAEVIEPLLSIATGHDLPLIRERAFCALAQSGTLHLAERYEALPGLLAIAETSADAQTLEWTYQALKEISNLYGTPDHPQAWRKALEEIEAI